ncbi:MAG: hypothetical protein H7306_08830 [Bacteriovorax sp.]|nr:hypothetical protein [Rhizobacter sp.]
MAIRIHYLAFVGAVFLVGPPTGFAAQATQTPSAAGAPAPSDVNTNRYLRAAAEPFENLTEISFSAAWPKIDRAIGQAEAAATGVRGALTGEAAGQLNARIAAIKSARHKRDRAELALSSIETYRVLVSAVTDNAKVPTEVSLLDYAGFRYDANLKATATGWDDMARAASFARATWKAVAPRVKTSPVATRFEKALTDMENAAVQRSKSLAASSVKAELELVDQLENFFSRH